MTHSPARKMMAIVMIAILVGALVAPSTASAWYARTAFPVSLASGPQNYAAIDGNVIVWRDGRDGTCGSDGTAWNIWMYDLSTGVEKPVTMADKKQQYPEISGDIVVYQTDEHCNSDGNSDVLMYDIAADEISDVVTDTAWQGAPDVDGDIVVWQDRRNGADDIYARDLSTESEFEVCTASGYQYDPAISGDIVVWQDTRNDGNGDIYMYDLATDTETLVCGAAGYQYQAVTDGTTIAWIDERSGNDAIYMYDIASAEETLVAEAGCCFDDIAIDNGTLAWKDDNVGAGDLFLYDIAAGTTEKVAVTSECEGMPAISNGIVAFNRYDPSAGEPDLWAAALYDIPTEYVELEGPDRYETAVMTSQENFPNGADTVIVSTGLNWPDALGASSLAGMYSAPILLTDPEALPSTVADEITRLGAVDAFIIGGEEAVSADVEAELAGLLSGEVTRLGGADRWATACLVASETVDANPDWDGTAFVTTGLNFPDALSAAPLAAKAGYPIFLSNAEGIPADTQARMGDLGVNNLLVLGGTGVVPATVTAQEMSGMEVERLGGMNRYGTSLAVATWGADNLDMHWNHVALATGENYPDALSAGAAQGQLNCLMLLTPSDYLDSTTAAGIAAHKIEIGNVVFVGGESAVSANVRAEVANLLP